MTEEINIAPAERVGTTSTLRVTENDLKLSSIERGMIGGVLGTRTSAPINIAGFVIIVCTIALLFTPFIPNSETLTRGDFAKIVGSLILSSFTFLGGYLGGSKGK